MKRKINNNQIIRRLFQIKIDKYWGNVMIGSYTGRRKKKREVKRRRHLVTSPCFWSMTFTSVLVFQLVQQYLVVRAVKMGRPNMHTEWSSPLVHSRR